MRVGCLALLAAVQAAGCRSPTQVSVEVTTDVSCAGFHGASVTVGLGAIEEGAPVASSTRCDGGTVVVVPSGSKSDEVAIKVVTGVSIPTSECKFPKYQGCIVARRALHFLPHEPLTVRVQLSIDCQDNPCDPTKTCVPKRGCVPATIADPDRCKGGGCGDEVLDPGTVGPSDASVLQMTLSRSLACVIMRDRTARCWGLDERGGLGDGGSGRRCPAATVVGLDGGRSIGLGELHGGAARTDGTVRCWGENYKQQAGIAGDAGPLLPTVVPGLADVVEISGRNDTTCAHHGDGHVSCWGSGIQGSLGDGKDEDSAHGPQTVAGVTDVVQVVGTCARTSKGEVKCWGGGLLTPKSVPGVSDAIDLAVARSQDIYVLRATGDIVAVSPRLTGDYTTLPAPPRVAKAKQIAINTDLFVLLDDGSVVRIPGRTGTPVAIPELGPGSTVEVRAGWSIIFDADFQCVRAKDGTVRCWGGDFDGEVGIDRPSAVRVATKIPKLGGVKLLRANVGQFTGGAFAVLTDGSIWAWGADRALGIAQPTAGKVASLGFDNIFAATNLQRGEGYLAKTGGTLAGIGPGAVPLGTLALLGRTDLVDIVMAPEWEVGFQKDGGFSFHALSDSANAHGIFANGTVAAKKGSTSPLTLARSASGISFAPSDYARMFEHACAWLDDGALQCWGSNDRGETGLPASASPTVNPTTVSFPTGTKIVHACAGYEHSCAVGSGGEVWCFGRNDLGQLGIGSTTESHIPAKLGGVSGAKGVACNDHSTCAWLGDGTVKCWGDNEVGQLADGTLVRRNTPVTAVGLTSVASLSRSCALHTDGTVSCWGESFNGQVGIGIDGIVRTPTKVVGLE